VSSSDAVWICLHNNTCKVRYGTSLKQNEKWKPNFKRSTFVTSLAQWIQKVHLCCTKFNFILKPNNQPPTSTHFEVFEIITLTQTMILLCFWYLHLTFQC
jgi:hypothetical protein